MIQLTSNLTTALLIRYPKVKNDSIVMDPVINSKLDNPVGQWIIRLKVRYINNIKKVLMIYCLFYTSSETTDEQPKMKYSRNRLYWAHQALEK